MSIEWGLPTVWELLKGAVNLIRSPVKYAMSSKSFADRLREEVQSLENEARRVDDFAQGARNNLRIPNDCFTEWQQSANKAMQEARNLLVAFDEASKTCCYGTLPDPYSRYRFSTKAKAKIKVVQEIARNCIRFRALDDICLTDARRKGKDAVQATTATASVFPASKSIKLRDAGVFESRALMIQKITEALASKSNSAVGVYRMGGVGKSTLLEEVERMLREKQSYDWVAKADVSENPNIKTIQEEIANGLRLTDLKKEETIGGRAKLLRERLETEEREKKSVLIILDNLWEGLDLKSVGIPCGYDSKVIGCKLLLTSRDQRVLRRKMRCDKDFLLAELEEEESKRLFEMMVGGKVQDELEPLVEEALNICSGLPFLIRAIATIFIDTDYSECEYALKQIWNEEIGEVINNTLRLSYDRLKSDEAKNLLRLCVICGTTMLSIEDLVRYGMGLKLFPEDSSMKEARDRLSSLIRTLRASSLLLDDEDVDSFKIHDLVRGFVTSVASRDHPLLVLRDDDKSVNKLSKDKLKSCKSCGAICFSFDDLKELPKGLDCPKLQIFLLYANNKSLEVPDSYFNSMRSLMVLDLTRICLTRSPSPFQSLESLHTMCLDFCSLEDVAILGELKTLQILSMQYSNLHQLPREIGQLTELRLLDINHCSQLRIIEPGVLGSLTKLEELYMEDSFNAWNAVELTPGTNANLRELNNMENLCTLYVSIPDPSVLPKVLNFERLTKFKIQMGEPWRWESCNGLSMLELKLDPESDVLRNGCIQSILGKTDDLFLEDLNGSEQSIYMLSHKGFPQLKHLQVKNSSSVHYILQSSSRADFEKLESLLLERLIRLEKICHGRISSKSIGALKVIRVKSCDNMEVLLPLSVVRGLLQLEEIAVDDCKLMCGIVEVDDRGKLELPKLRVLKLYDLPNIKSFFTDGTASSSRTSDDQAGTPIAFFNGQQVSIPSLESLTMEGLPNLKEIWSDESPLELSNLQFINIKQCQSLSKVIGFRSLMNLQKLRTLTIRSCTSMQEIFYLEASGGGGNYRTLSERVTFSLEELAVYDCDNLRFVFFPFMVKPLAQLRDLQVSWCKKMEAIIMEEEPLGLEISETLAFPMLTKLHLR